MTLVNGGLLLILSSSGEQLFWLVASIVGIPVCIVWTATQRRYGQWCTWWDNKLKEIEKEYFETLDSRPTVQVFFAHAPMGRQEYIQGWSIRKATGYIPIIFMVGWFVVLMYTLCMLYPQFLFGS